MASAPFWPTITKASVSAAPTMSWSSATARSISPTLTVPCACATRIQKRNSISMRCSGGRTASSRSWRRTCPIPMASPSHPTRNIFMSNGSRDNYVNRYEVQPDGTLANGKLFFDMRGQTEPGITDGLRVDTKGNIYETGPGGVWVISPEGKHLGTIRAPEMSTNIGFSDADKKTLYIAARSSIYRIRVNTPGI